MSGWKENSNFIGNIGYLESVSNKSTDLVSVWVSGWFGLGFQSASFYSQNMSPRKPMACSHRTTRLAEPRVLWTALPLNLNSPTEPSWAQKTRQIWCLDRKMLSVKCSLAIFRHQSFYINARRSNQPACLTSDKKKQHVKKVSRSFVSPRFSQTQEHITDNACCHESATRGRWQKAQACQAERQQGHDCNLCARAY